MSGYQLTDEQRAYQARAKEYASIYTEQAAQWDEADQVDIHPIVKRAADFGLTGLTLPVEYGGKGVTALEWTVAVEEIARTAQSWIPADPLFMTAGPGPAVILASHNETLKRRVLPQLAHGEAIAAANITEAEAGSGMTDLSTVAVADGEDFVVTGQKRYITGAGDSHYLVTFCRFDDIPGAKGIGAVLIERDREGVIYGRNPHWTGLRGIPHPEVTLDAVSIPKENLLFPAGDFARLMRAFNMERLHNAILSLGFGQAALDLTMEFVRQRCQFGRPIVEFQGVQWQVADMQVDVEAARALIYRAASSAVEGKYPVALDISVAKLYANEMGIRVTHTACDLHGALGYTRDTPVERLLRDALLLPIAGGTLNILRNTIAAELFRDAPLSQRRPSTLVTT
jgi:butyryl-CoA dehydrogenase